MTEGEPPSRLNVFALPSQTTLLFWLITLVLLGAAAAGNFYEGPPFLLFFAGGLLLLPLRGFLSYTEQKKKAYELQAIDEEFAPLQARVRHLASNLGLKRTPRLLTSDRPLGVRVLGSWRHWYVVAGKGELRTLQERLADAERVDQVDARLTHELYHFKTGDYWQMEYLEVLFRVGVQFTAWMVLFLMGLILLLQTAARDVFSTSPEELVQAVAQQSPLAGDVLAQGLAPIPHSEWVAAREQVEQINFGFVLGFAVSAMLPFVLLGAILRLLFWPKFWRTREFYADAGVLHSQGESLPLLANILGVPLRYLRRDPQGWEKSFRTALTSQMRQRPLRERLRRFQGAWYHPRGMERIRAMVEPSRIYDGWLTTALLIGTLALMLDILLASPLTLPLIGDWPMHFTVLMVYVVAAFALLPPIIERGGGWRELLGIVAIVVGIRTIWLLLTIALLVGMLVVNPAALDAMLQVVVASIARFFGFSDELGFESLPQFVMEASFLAIAQLVIILLLLLLALGTFHLLVQRLLTWYSFLREAAQFRRLTYVILLASGLFWIGVMLPFLTLAL